MAFAEILKILFCCTLGPTKYLKLIQSDLGVPRQQNRGINIRIGASRFVSFAVVTIHYPPLHNYCTMEINRGRSDRAERLKSNDSPSGGSGKRARLADDASTSLLVCQRSKTESDDCVFLAGNNMIQRPWALTMESLRSYSRPKNKHDAYLHFFRTPELDSALKFFVACHYAPTRRRTKMLSTPRFLTV